MSTENDESLESLLVNIRSVVLSSKGGVLLSQMQNDYRKFIGTRIPFEKFGYDHLDQLLLDATNYISIKKNSNGQLYAEAIADSTTAHLTRLVSRQKSVKAKKEPKLKIPKKNTCSSCRSRLDNFSSSMNSISSTASKSADEKDKEIEELRNKLERDKSMNEELSFEVKRLQTQLKIANKALQSERNYVTRHNYQENDVREIQDLKMKLEKEMRINKGYSSEVERINSLLFKAEDALLQEKANSQKLLEQLKSSQLLMDEKSGKEEEINALKKEIEELNSKHEKGKKLNRDFTSQIIRLNSLVRVSQDSLSTEQEIVKKLKSQIEALQSSPEKETPPVYEYLNSASSSSKEKCTSLKNLSKSDSWGRHLNLMETDSAKELNSSSIILATNDEVLGALKSCEKQMSEHVNKFENRVNKMNLKLLTLEKTQNRHYSQLDSKIKFCKRALDIESVIQKILEHPQFLESISSYVSFCNLSQSIPNATPNSSLSDNDSEQSFKTTTVSTIGRGKYGPPQEKAYKRNLR